MNPLNHGDPNDPDGGFISQPHSMICTSAVSSDSELVSQAPEIVTDMHQRTAFTCRQVLVQQLSEVFTDEGIVQMVDMAEREANRDMAEVDDVDSLQTLQVWTGFTEAGIAMQLSRHRKGLVFV